MALLCTLGPYIKVACKDKIRITIGAGLILSVLNKHIQSGSVSPLAGESCKSCLLLFLKLIHIYLFHESLVWIVKISLVLLCLHVCVWKGVLMWQNMHRCEHSALLNPKCPLTWTNTHKHIKTHTDTHTSQRWDGCRQGGRSAAIRGAVCVMVAMCRPISSTITHTHTAPTSRIPPRYRTLLKTLATNALMPSRRRGVWLELKWQTERNAGSCLLSVWGRALSYFWFKHDGTSALLHSV